MRSQCRRAGADLWTTNRPDAGLTRQLTRKFKNKSFKTSETGGRVFQSVKRQREYQGYRPSTPEPESSGRSMPILIGAAMIAAAILLSTLINALGSRYVGLESPTEETAWLVDRLTGSIYRCQASERGRASCDPTIASGSIPERAKH